MQKKWYNPRIDLLSLIHFGMSTLSNLGPNKEKLRINQPLGFQIELSHRIKPKPRSHLPSLFKTYQKPTNAKPFYTIPVLKLPSSTNIANRQVHKWVLEKETERIGNGNFRDQQNVQRNTSTANI